MAKVITTDEKYMLVLSFWERIFSLHGNLEAPKSSLASITRVNKPWTRELLRGVRAPGTALPYLVLLGTMRYRGGKDFTAIYKRKPVDVYTFTTGEFNRWIVSSS
jgi:hypothetical protein